MNKVLPPMEARRVMLRVADHVEAEPRRYKFMTFGQATSLDCGTPHCLLGWGAAVIGRRFVFLDEVAQALGFSNRNMRGSFHFYNAMSSVCNGSNLWRDDAHEAARCLRLLADKMYPVTPDWNALAAPGDALRSQAGAMEVVR